MSARLILGLEKSQGFGCSPIKAARELGSDRRETGWSPIRCRRRNLREFFSQYERTERNGPLVCQLSCQGHRWVAMFGSDKS